MGLRLVEGMQGMTQREVASDRFQTTLTLRVNGVPFAVCSSDAGVHAEAYACAFLKDALTTGQRAAAMLSEAEQAYPMDNARVAALYDIFITRSPCIDCTNKLIKTFNLFPSDRTMRIFCATVHGGENRTVSRSNIEALRSAGISVFRWDFRAMGRTGDPDSLTICQVASGVSNWDSYGEHADHGLSTRTLDADLDLLPNFSGQLYSVG